MIIEQFNLDHADLQNHANIGCHGDRKEEKLITAPQRDDFLKNYSVIIEDKRWLPIFIKMAWSQ